MSLAAISLRAADVLPLAGQWRFALDPNDAGTNEHWYARELGGRIQLPGILQAQGFGDDIATNTPWVLTLGDAWWKTQPPPLREHFSQPGHVEVPFLSQPPKHYLGAAWYQRDIEIPRSWHGRHLTLFLERAHWQSTVWVDEQEFPANDSLGAPHVTDLGTLAPGKHRVTIRVDNRTRLPEGHHLVDSHSISDALGAAWNGIVGKIELRGMPPVWLDDIQVYPQPGKKTALVKVTIGNATGKSGTGSIKINEAKFPASWSTNGATFQWEIPLGAEAKDWDEFSPALTTVSISLDSAAGRSSENVRFGLRDIVARDQDILINGRPVNLRLTHFGGDFPLTGYPAMDKDSWRRIFQTCKNYGLNGMRFHSWCPPEAAFEAADELGFYLQPECGLWADFGTPQMRQWLADETARLLAAYGNHPSFILLSPSNEPKNYLRCLPQWAAENYARDHRRLYAADSGWGDPAQVEGGAQYAVLARFRDGQNLRNSAGWFGSDYRDALKGVHIPVLAHEVGQWCAYPDFDVIKKFTGYLRPGNYDIFKYIAEQQGVLDENHEFAHASGRFQLACYKEEIEANLRTPGLAGFQLLDLHDYLGQGTALIGVLDAFWQDKGYAGAGEFRQFCNATVPLARLKKRTFTTADDFSVPVEVAHFGPAPLNAVTATWQILNTANDVVAHGNFAATDIPIGKNFPLGTVVADLSKLTAPAQYRLCILIGGRANRVSPFLNTWNFWLYPPSGGEAKAGETQVTEDWSEAEKVLAAGGKVLFMPTSANLDAAKCPPMKTVPVFWNIQMTVRPPQNPRPRFDAFLGLLCQTNHPALAEFPTEENCDWQWTPLINGVRAVNLKAAPWTLRPIVWAIDDWNRNWKLGVIFECNVGSGRLLVSAIDLNDERGGAGLQQLRRSLLDYMGSEKFHPATTLTLGEVRGLWSHGQAAASEPARVFDPDLNDGSVPAPRPHRKSR
ncbi:MAG TPA: glycoside hydrolase [Verrucomicrobiae bacterium]